MKETGYGLRQFMYGIWKLISPFKKYLFLILFCVTIELSYAIVLPLGLKILIDQGMKHNDLTLIIQVISGLGIIYAIYTVIYILDAYIMSILTAKALDKLRSRMINQVYCLPVNYYQQNKSTSILSRFSNDVSTIENVFNRAIMGLLYFTGLIVCCTIILFFIQWRLALVVICLSPLLIIIPKKISQKATTSNYSYKTKQEDLLNIVQEQINGQTIIRFFGLRNYMMNMYSKSSQKVVNNGTQSLYLSLLVGVTTNIGADFLLLAVIALGSVLSVKGFMTAGTFIAFSAYLFSIASSTEGLSNIIPILYQSIGSMQRIDEFVGKKTLHDKQHKQKIELPQLTKEICFKDVSFSYDGKKAQIDNVNFKIHKGTLTAFIGKSGVGKTTLSKLIMNFLLPDKGVISMDDIDISLSDIDSLRSQMSAVFQDTFLFNTSIKDNIRYGRLEATDEEIIEAAQYAKIYDWIMTLPEKFDTTVGEDGENLSGGQRQRIAIARALVRKPKLLILDEAFSALDPATEFLVHETIKTLAKKMTVILITHNLTSVCDYNQIFVLADGQLLEQGSHQNLLSQKGLYYDLWQKQTGLYFKKDSQEYEITIERLAKVPLLSAMNTNELECIKDQLTTETFEQGKKIIRQGDPGKRFYIIAKGIVEIERTDSNQKMHHIGVMEIGDYFGEISLFINCPITATVRARSETVCLALSRNHFQRLLDRNPELEKRMKEVAEQKISTDEIRRLSV